MDIATAQRAAAALPQHIHALVEVLPRQDQLALSITLMQESQRCAVMAHVDLSAITQPPAEAPQPPDAMADVAELARSLVEDLPPGSDKAAALEVAKGAARMQQADRYSAAQKRLAGLVNELGVQHPELAGKLRQCLAEMALADLRRHDLAPAGPGAKEPA